MSDTFDHEGDAWNDAESRDIYDEMSFRGFDSHLRARPTPPPPARCNNCGSTTVKWRELDTGWRLFDTTRRLLLPHNCLHAAASPDEFESA